MSLKVNKGTDFKQVEPGTHPGRCFKIIDLGTQHSTYEGHEQVKKQVLINWELPTELIPDGEFKGQPYAVGRFYTASLNEKSNLRKDLEAWRGKAFTDEELDGFHLGKLLGQTCMLSVTHNTKGKAQVVGVMKLMKGVKVPDAVNSPVMFDISEWNEEIFESLSDGIKDMIRKSDEYKERQGIPISGPENEGMLDEGEIPF